MIMDFDPIQCLLLVSIIIVVINVGDKILEELGMGYTKKGYCYAS